MNDVAHATGRRTLLSVRPLLVLLGISMLAGCAGKPLSEQKIIYESGLSTVRLEGDPDSSSNSHPASLSATDVGTLLRGVRVWERRNIIHRLLAGEADRTRAFRDEDIRALAPALSKGLAQATPAQRVYFHLSHPTDQGEEETTTGWLSIRDLVLYLSLSEVHDRHGPGPDISKYDRQMPNVPERSSAFDATFEPEDYLVRVQSGGRLFAPDQREELQIRYQEALSVLPVYPGLEPRQQIKTPRP